MNIVVPEPDDVVDVNAGRRLQSGDRPPLLPKQAGEILTASRPSAAPANMLREGTPPPTPDWAATPVGWLCLERTLTVRTVPTAPARKGKAFQLPINSIECETQW